MCQEILIILISDKPFQEGSKSCMCLREPDQSGCAACTWVRARTFSSMINATPHTGPQPSIKYDKCLITKEEKKKERNRVLCFFSP